jgi:hypothetical protein
VSSSSTDWVTPLIARLSGIYNQSRDDKVKDEVIVRAAELDEQSRR